VELFLVLGQIGERVDRQQQGAGLLIVHVEDLHVDYHVRIHVAAQVAVDEFELAAGQFVGEQAAGEADVAIGR